MINTIRQELRSVIAFIGVIWCTFVLDFALPWNLNTFGVTPRTLVGLAGIVAMPFLHANMYHLISNTVSLMLLLVLLAGSRVQSLRIVAVVVLFSGALLWVFGRPATHVGASALIFGLIAFLIISGLLEKRMVPLLVSLVVGSIYGGTLLWGVLPRLGSQVSWDGHLCGAIAGGTIAYALTKTSVRQERPAR